MSLKGISANILKKLYGITGDSYVTGTAYTAGAYVIYDGDFYKALVDTSTSWVAAEWSKVNVASQLGGGISDWSCIAPEYSETTQYYPNDIIIHEGKTYYCKGKSLPGPWNPDEWIECPLSKLIIYDAIADIWSTETAYGAGKWVTYRGALYICGVEQATIGEFKDDEWIKSSIDETVRYMVMTMMGWIAPYFEEREYEKHSTVLHEDIPGDMTSIHFYRAKTNLVAGPWNPDDWEQTNLSETRKDLAFQKSITDEWKYDKTYVKGDCVMMNGKLCKAVVDNPTVGTFLNDEWDLTNTFTELAGGGEKGIAPIYSATTSYETGSLYMKNNEVYYTAAGGVAPADEKKSTAYDYMKAFIKAVETKFGQTAEWGWDTTNSIPTCQFKTASAGKYFTATPTYLSEDGNGTVYSAKLYSPEKASTVTDKYIIVGDKINYRIPVGKRLKITNSNTTDYSLVVHSVICNGYAKDESILLVKGDDVTTEGNYDRLPDDIVFPAEGEVTKSLATSSTGTNTISTVNSYFTSSDNVYTYAYPILDSTTRMAHTFYIKFNSDPGTVTEETIATAVDSFEFTIEDDDTAKGYFAEITDVTYDAGTEETHINITKKIDESVLLLPLTSSIAKNGFEIFNKSGDLSKYEYKIACIRTNIAGSSNQAYTVDGYKCFNNNASSAYFDSTRVLSGEFKGKYMYNDGTTSFYININKVPTSPSASYISEWKNFDEEIKFVDNLVVAGSSTYAICYIMIRHKDSTPMTISEGELFDCALCHAVYGGTSHVYTNYYYYETNSIKLNTNCLGTTAPVANNISGYFINGKLIHLPKDKMITFAPPKTISNFLSRTLYLVHSADIVSTAWTLDSDGNYILNTNNTPKFHDINYKVFNNNLTKINYLDSFYATADDDVYIFESIYYDEASTSPTLSYDDLEAAGLLTTIVDAPKLVAGNMDSSTRQFNDRTSTNTFIALGKVFDWDNSNIYRRLCFSVFANTWGQYVKVVAIDKPAAATVTSAFARVSDGYEIVDTSTSNLSFSNNPGGEMWQNKLGSASISDRVLVPYFLNDDHYYGIVVYNVPDKTTAYNIAASMNIYFDDGFINEHVIGTVTPSTHTLNVLNTNGAIWQKGLHLLNKGSTYSLNEDYGNSCIAYIFEGSFDTDKFYDNGALIDEFRTKNQSIDMGSTLTYKITLDDYSKSYTVPVVGDNTYMIIQNAEDITQRTNIVNVDNASFASIIKEEEYIPNYLAGAELNIENDNIVVVPDTTTGYRSSYIINDPFTFANISDDSLKITYTGTDTGVNIKVGYINYSAQKSDMLKEISSEVYKFKQEAQVAIDEGTTFNALIFDDQWMTVPPVMYELNTTHTEQEIKDNDDGYYLAISFTSTANVYTYEQAKAMIKIEYNVPNEMSGSVSSNGTEDELYYIPYDSNEGFMTNKPFFKVYTEDKIITGETNLDVFDDNLSGGAYISIVHGAKLNIVDFADNGNNTYSMKHELSYSTQIGTTSAQNDVCILDGVYTTFEFDVVAGDMVCVEYGNLTGDIEIVDQIKQMYTLNL